MRLTQYNYQLKKTRQKKTLFIIVFCILLFIFVNLILTYLIFPVRQNSSSMSPDIPENSLIMLSPLAKSYERGDVVLIKSRKPEETKAFKKFCNKFLSFFTGQQYTPFENEKLAGTKEQLRRIVGMPGDTIYMRDYVMYIKPKSENLFLTEFEITPKAYNVTFFAAPAGWDSSIGVKGSFDQIVLADDEYFVLGDNRKSTDDSRLWGAITKDKIAGKALICYFPFQKIKLF